MMCDVIIYFVVVYLDGHKEARMRWLPRDHAKTFVSQLKQPDELNKWDINLVNVENIKVQTVKPFNCNKGPTDEQTKTKSK